MTTKTHFGQMIQKLSFTIILILIIFNVISLKAQPSSQRTNQLKFSAEQNTFLSYSGLNLSLIGATNYSKHALGIGINTSIQNNYLPYRQSIGFTANYKYFFISNKKIKGFLSINYINSNYNSSNRTVSQKNRLHEYLYGNGFLARIYKGFWIGNSIGFGGYTERYYDISESTYKKNTGYNYQLNAIFRYDF